MSSFETIQDAAFALKAEGQEIKINFKKGVPTTGQATVEWTIPKPAQGCENSDTGAYAGIVILLGTEAMDATNIPVDGKVYVADPTADSNLSVGDRIGAALVVGAVYECEERARGETLTTTVVINDIDPQTGYYVAGYAVDCQNRYHSDGIRAYSDVFSNKEDGSISAAQEVLLGTNQRGVLPTDGTGLIPGVDYEFDLIYDNTFPEGTDWKTINITIDGINAGTYQQLLDEIRNDILLIDNPLHSPTVPNADAFFWNATEQQLYSFDGYTYTAIDSINEDTDPALTTVDGTNYWFNTLTKELFNGLGGTFATQVPYVTTETDPTTPTCDSIWYDPDTAAGSPIEPVTRTWNGTNWCDEITFSQTTDPTECPAFECTTYWFDETTSVLNEWDEDLLKWNATSAIVWPTSPDDLPNGTYWYDDIALTLSVRSAGAWSDITAATAIQETEPLTPVDGLLWYIPSTEVLQEYSVTSPVGWTVLPVLVWEGDPTIVGSCDLWWNTTDDNLYNYNSTGSPVWVQVTAFIQSATDPALAATIAVDSFWYNTTLLTLSRYDGSAWNIVTDFMVKETDPSKPITADAWYKPSTNTWNQWSGLVWVEIFPIDSETDPSVLPAGTYWFDTANTALYIRAGSPPSTWSTVMFVTQPFAYTRGTQWYDTTNNDLFEWSGTTWLAAVPVVDVAFTTAGHFLFWTRERGSHTAVLIPTPEGSTAHSTPCSIGTGYAYSGVNDIAAAECEYANDGNVIRVYPARSIPNNSFLWSNIPSSVITPKGGNDGISGVPSYLEQGVGTDGTPDERRELMDSIRRQLGYPVVEVELDNVQLDTCVNLGLEEYRKRAAGSTRRGFFFLDIAPGKQQYLMTNKIIGYNRIVTVMAAYRFTSAFLSSAHGAGAYGQIVLQHLYNMGTYDLTSFFLVSQYVEQLEHLFATRLTFSFHENDRLLSFYSAFTRAERVLIDCMVERTEQDLLKDRYSKTWIERYALAEAMMMLSHIRGKFASLPGAGGGISLNAAELVTLAQTYREDLILQLDEYVADAGLEDTGMQGSFILG